MKKSLLFVLFVMLASVALMAAAPAATALARLEIINKTGEDINIKLETASGDVFYYLTADGEAGKVITTEFTVEREYYKATVWSCGKRASAWLDMETNVRLNFPSCATAPNSGDPTMEKVVLKDYPEGGQYWRFQ